MGRIMKTTQPLKNDRRVLSEPSLKREYNRALFGVVAPRYFIATRVLSFFRDRAWKRFLIAGAGSAACDRVLDIASGSGDLAALAMAKWPGATVVGADISLAMMFQAKRRKGTENLPLVCTDMSSLAVQSRSIDLVTAGYALRNAPDLSKALDETARVLRPGGTAAFLDFSRSPRRVVFFFQYWILRLWGAFWGFVLHGNPAVYAYIAESLKMFPHRDALRDGMIRAGFRNVVFHRRMAGLIDVITAQSHRDV